MPGGTLITFQEGLRGLWKIPRLFWDEAPFSALSQGKGPGDPPFPGDRQGGSGFLASPPLGPRSPLLAGHSSEPRGADWLRGIMASCSSETTCFKNTALYAHSPPLLAFPP